MTISYRLTTFAAILLLSLTSLPTGNAADVGLDRKEIAGSYPRVTIASVIISGQIVTGDAKKVEKLLDEVKRTDDGHQIRRLLIHSQGGLVGEAIQIGKMVRANNVEVFLPQGTSCISACVLILAGAKIRIINGRVGIDYPHFLQKAGPNDDVPALLAEVKEVMRSYYHSMGVNERLADATFLVPKGVVHFLTLEELYQYQLK